MRSFTSGFMDVSLIFIQLLYDPKNGFRFLGIINSSTVYSKGKSNR